MATPKEATREVPQQELTHQQMNSPVAASSTTQQLMGMIAVAARDPNTDVEKMERLMAMMERMEKMRAEREFNDKLTICQQRMPRLVRDGHNPETKSRFAKLDSAITKITPIYTEQGFNISFSTEKSDLPEHIKMVAHVSCGGHTRIYSAEMPYDYLGPKGTANKTKIHGVGSAFSYARRYLLYMIFNIALAGEDNDGNGGQPPQPQAGPGMATIEMRTKLVTRLADVKEKALAYFIDKGIIMPDKGLADLPLNKVPLTEGDYKKLRSEIENHK